MCLKEQVVVDYVNIGKKLLNISKEMEVRFYPFGSAAACAQMLDGEIELWFNIPEIEYHRTEFTVVEAVAHELIHAYQIIGGRLILAPNKMVFEGTDYIEHFKVALQMGSFGDNSYYKKLPWEAEAFAGMKELGAKIEEIYNART